MMDDKVMYWEFVSSCESCPGSVPEGHRVGTYHAKFGQFRCKHNTDIVFQQNRDMGVPKNCPKRKLPDKNVEEIVDKMMKLSYDMAFEKKLLQNDNIA